MKRVEISKPDGGIRKLGIPTVVDRFIQQAVQQVLTRRWDDTFSQGSFCFRPGRSAHQAVETAQNFIAEGCAWVVDIDLEKFFDRVNHDRLMARIMRREDDKALIKLIRSILTSGVLENGLVSPTDDAFHWTLPSNWWVCKYPPRLRRGWDDLLYTLTYGRGG